MVDSLFNIIGISFEPLPVTFVDLMNLYIRLVVGLGIIMWCFDLIKTWSISLFGGRWSR